jgi:hypothetical protein
MRQLFVTAAVVTAFGLGTVTAQERRTDYECRDTGGYSRTLNAVGARAETVCAPPTRSATRHRCSRIKYAIRGVATIDAECAHEPHEPAGIVAIPADW